MFKRRLQKKSVGLSDEEFEEFKNLEFMRMWRFPWGLWIMSFMCFAATAFLVASVTVLDIIEIRPGEFWQHAIILSFFIFSLLFFLFAKVEIVSFDKESQEMRKSKWVLCFNWKTRVESMKNITDVNLVLMGRNDKYASTLYYKVSIVLRNSKPISILETKNRRKVIEKALKLRAFFNIKGKIPLSDISTD